MNCIFDRSVLLRHAARARPAWTQHDFLWAHTARQLRDRLLDMRRDFPHAIEWGAAPMVFDRDIRLAKKVETVSEIIADDAVLPFGAEDIELFPAQPQSCDIIVAHNQLHWVNDVPGVLVQMRRALKPDGVLLGSFFGGDTLYELRQSIAAVELEMYGGMSPRLSPFATLQDAAALLQRTGFALPVADQDRMTITYKDVPSMVRDLRGMGQTHAVVKRDKRIVRRDFWPRVDAYYREHFSDARGRLIVTVDSLYLLGWAPAPTQPVPLARGSATHSLADILKKYE